MSSEMIAAWTNANFHDDHSGKLIVFFHQFQKKMTHQSELEGRPVFKEVTYITKIVPGTNGHTVDREIRQADKEEFAEKWEYYQRTQQNKVTGIPLDYWPALTDNQKITYKASNIQTVEQFANLSDGTCQQLGAGTLDLRRKAQIFVEAGKDAELLGTVRAEAEKREQALNDKLAALEAKLEAMTAGGEAKRGPGRPPNPKE
jgi:hypothetical protein